MNVPEACLAVALPAYRFPGKLEPGPSGSKTSPRPPPFREGLCLISRMMAV